MNSVCRVTNLTVISGPDCPNWGQSFAAAVLARGLPCRRGHGKDPDRCPNCQPPNAPEPELRSATNPIRRMCDCNLIRSACSPIGVMCSMIRIVCSPIQVTRPRPRPFALWVRLFSGIGVLSSLLSAGFWPRAFYIALSPPANMKPAPGSPCAHRLPRPSTWTRRLARIRAHLHPSRRNWRRWPMSFAVTGWDGQSSPINRSTGRQGLQEGLSGNSPDFAWTLPDLRHRLICWTDFKNGSMSGLCRAP